MKHQEPYKNLNIVRVIPADWYELIIELSNGEKRVFPGSKELYKTHGFLAYPDKLRAFEFDEKHIEWGHELKFDLQQLLQHSERADDETLKKKPLSISRKNQAPTEKHAKHHIYEVAIKPYDSDRLFILSESIGGGIADGGGAHYFTLEALIKSPGWKEHFKLSDCEWGIELVERCKAEPVKLIARMVDRKLEEYSS